jgi:hypothetical protein
MIISNAKPYSKLLGREGARFVWLGITSFMGSITFEVGNEEILNYQRLA